MYLCICVLLRLEFDIRIRHSLSISLSHSLLTVIFQFSFGLWIWIARWAFVRNSTPSKSPFAFYSIWPASNVYLYVCTAQSQFKSLAHPRNSTLIFNLIFVLNIWWWWLWRLSPLSVMDRTNKKQKQIHVVYLCAIVMALTIVNHLPSISVQC